MRDQNQNNPRFNGVDLRVNTIDNAFNDVWAVHPFVGGGLKYFQASFNQAGGAEQVFVAELAEAGIVGLFGLLFLLQGTGLVGGSPMTNDHFWIYAGAVIALVGAGVLITGLRRPARR